METKTSGLKSLVNKYWIWVVVFILAGSMIWLFVTNTIEDGQDAEVSKAKTEMHQDRADEYANDAKQEAQKDFQPALDSIRNEQQKAQNELNQIKRKYDEISGRYSNDSDAELQRKVSDRFK